MRKKLMDMDNGDRLNARGGVGVGEGGGGHKGNKWWRMET